jgi:hypothetical protein
MKAINISERGLDSRKLKSLASLSSTINKLNKANVCGEFNGELEFLIKIKDNIKDSLITGEGRFIGAIIS